MGSKCSEVLQGDSPEYEAKREHHILTDVMAFKLQCKSYPFLSLTHPNIATVAYPISMSSVAHNSTADMGMHTNHLNY